MAIEIHRYLFAAACAIGLSGPACAQTTPASQLTDLQAQIPVLKAQAQIAKLRAEINAAGSPGLTRMGSGSINAAPGASPGAPAWRVMEINGFGGQYSATLIDNEGQAHDVTPGLVLPDGWRVASIAPHTVVLIDGAKHRTLEF